MREWVSFGFAVFKMPYNRVAPFLDGGQCMEFHHPVYRARLQRQFLSL